MVNSAIHSRFASHRQSRRTPAADHGQRDAQPAELVAAAAQDGATPLLSRWWAGWLRSAWSWWPVAPALPQCACGNDNTEPTPDANVATTTTPESPLHCARPPRPTARTGDEFPHSLAGPESAVGFEGCQTARSWPILQPLFWRHFGTCFLAYHRQKRLRPHRQGHVTIPASPRAHFIVIQPHLALGGLDTFLDRPAHAGHLHLFGQGGACQSKSNIRGQLTRIANAAPHEQSALPALLRRIAQFYAPPVIPTRSFTACASADPFPPRRRQLSQKRLDLPLLVVERDRLVGRDRQHIGLLVPLQPPAQHPIVAVDTIARDPGQHYASTQRALQHLPRQRRFGRKGPLVGNTGSSTALAILGPFLWQIELAINQGLTMLARVGQENADLAVLDAAGRATIVPCEASRMAAFLKKAGFVKHTHRSGICQIVDHIRLQAVAQRIGVPVGPTKQVLKAIGLRIATDLGQLPAILAFGWAQQSAQIGQSTFLRVRTGKERTNPSLNLGPIHIPNLQ